MKEGQPITIKKIKVLGGALRYIGSVGNHRIYSDENTAPILTGEIDSGEEMTDLGISYRDLYKILNSPKS